LSFPAGPPNSIRSTPSLMNLRIPKSFEMA
jgi:hypothetical protein